jgi:hypothetical protein
MTSCTKITRNSNFKPPSFWIHHGKAIFLVATQPVCHFPSFKSSPSIRVHQGRLVGKRIIEKEQDLIEKTPRRMEISTWWEDLGTQLNTRTKNLYHGCFLKRPKRCSNTPSYVLSLCHHYRRYIKTSKETWGVSISYSGHVMCTSKLFHIATMADVHLHSRFENKKKE